MEKSNDKPKDLVKEKVILFVIGVLVGAVISTAAFLVYTKTIGVSNGGSSQQMPGGTPPEMPSGENGQGQPPEKPSDNSDKNNNSDNNKSDDSN